MLITEQNFVQELENSTIYNGDNSYLFVNGKKFLNLRQKILNV